MVENISLFHFDLQIASYKKKDLQNKCDLALKILKHCMKNDNNENQPSELSSPLEKCSELTDEPMETLLRVSTLEENRIKFEDWLSEQRRLMHSHNYDYDCLKKQLLDSYTKKLEIPLATKGSTDYDRYKNNFTLLQLPGTKSSIIVENPESVLERHKFLNTKMKHREAKKNLVYIGKINILMRNGKYSYREENIGAKSRFTLAVSPIFGQLGYIYSCANSQECILNWIEEKIIPELPKESVIIFQENVLNKADEVIGSLSTKEKMLNWLESNKVHHDPRMHRADLHKLISSFKESCDKQFSPTEETLKAHGFVVIRKKKCNLNVNFFDPFWDYLLEELKASVPENTSKLRNNLTNIITTASRIVENVSLDYWMELENILLKKELEIYKEDLEMEVVIDKLLTMVKYEGLPKEVKLNDYSKTMEQPPLFLADTFRTLSVSSNEPNSRLLNNE